MLGAVLPYLEDGPTHVASYSKKKVPIVLVDEHEGDAEAQLVDSKLAAVGDRKRLAQIEHEVAWGAGGPASAVQEIQLHLNEVGFTD